MTRPCPIPKGQLVLVLLPGKVGTRRTLGDRPSALSLGLAVLDQSVQHTTRWIGQPGLDPPVTLLCEVSRHTGQGASGAGGADESVKLTSVGLLPDLRAGREDMGASVGRVVKLVGPDGVVEGFRVSRGLVVVVLRVVKRDGWGGSAAMVPHRQEQGEKEEEERSDVPGTGRTSAPSMRRRSIFS